MIWLHILDYTTILSNRGAAEEDIESFIANVSSTGDDIPAENIIQCVNQLFNISKSELIPLDQISSYIERKLEEKRKIDEEIKQADAALQIKNVNIQTINEHIQLNERLNDRGLSTEYIEKLLNLIDNAKEYGFNSKKIVAKLRKIKRLEKKEEGLKNNCTILSRLLEEYKEIVPLAKKITALNIGINELMVFDTAVQEISKQYNLPPSVAALRLLNEIRDYDKIGGMKREISALCQQIFFVNGVWANQNKAMRTILNLQSRGITEDKILQLNSFLENIA